MYYNISLIKSQLSSDNSKLKNRVRELKENLKKLPDEKLVEIFRSDKSNEVFGILYERYKNMIYAYVKKFLYTTPEDIAGEVMHDIFISAYLSLVKIKNPLAFKVWLYQIARRTCLKYIRSVKFSTVSIEAGSDPSHTFDIPDKKINIEKEYIEKEIRLAVFDQIGRMDKQFREIVILKFVNKLTFEEISGIIKIPVRTIKYKLNRAFDRINKKLEREGYL